MGRAFGASGMVGMSFPGVKTPGCDGARLWRFQVGGGACRCLGLNPQAVMGCAFGAGELVRGGRGLDLMGGVIRGRGTRFRLGADRWKLFRKANPPDQVTGAASAADWG